MGQHPKVTVGWALRSLENALRNLGDGPAERRVRRQFHQLLLALERQSLTLEHLSPHQSPIEQDAVPARATHKSAR